MAGGSACAQIISCMKETYAIINCAVVAYENKSGRVELLCVCV